METIEPFDFAASESVREPSSHSVTLKDGIDLVQLSRGEGAEFEIQPPESPLDRARVSATMPTERSSHDGFDREELMKYMITDCIDAGGDSEAEDMADLSPFERMSLKMEDLSGGGGHVLKKLLRAGSGPTVPEGALVRVHYNGYLEFAEEPYDSSRLRNQQCQFTLGKGEVIAGWEVAVSSMKRTELSRYLVKPEYAFGAMGCPPRIPPAATIMFEIELVSFVDHKAADDFNALPTAERKEMTLLQLMEVADAEREAGNDFFQQKLYHKASNKYKRAAHLIESARLKNEEEERQWRQLLLKLYLNLSLCSLRLRRPKLTITQCRRALELEPKNVKAHFRLGQAFLQLSEFGKSRGYLIRAGRLSPANEEIRQELAKLDNAVQRFKSIERSMYGKMFSASDENGPPGQSSEEDEAQKETRKLLTERLRAFKSNPSMTEIVLPSSLSADDVKCAEQVASELGLCTEVGSGYAIRISKPVQKLQ